MERVQFEGLSHLTKPWCNGAIFHFEGYIYPLSMISALNAMGKLISLVLYSAYVANRGKGKRSVLDHRIGRHRPLLKQRPIVSQVISSFMTDSIEDSTDFRRDIAFNRCLGFRANFKILLIRPLPGLVLPFRSSKIPTPCQEISRSLAAQRIFVGLHGFLQRLLLNPNLLASKSLVPADMIPRLGSVKFHACPRRH